MHGSHLNTEAVSFVSIWPCRTIVVIEAQASMPPHSSSVQVSADKVVQRSTFVLTLLCADSEMILPGSSGLAQTWSQPFTHNVQSRFINNKEDILILIWFFCILTTFWTIHHLCRSLRRQSHSFSSEFRTVETNKLHPIDTHGLVYISSIRWINCLPMEMSKELLLATKGWDQKSPHRHQDKEIG